MKDNNKTIRVLWVEDNALITNTYPNEADMISGIVLYPFPNWEVAEKELENDYNNWDAIILDAKCKYKSNDADKADRFLSNVFADIRELASRKNRTIPWYVLSEQGEDDIRDLIPAKNYWDEEWLKHVNRRFYSKNGKVNIGGVEKHERHILFERIKNQVTFYNHEIQIEQNLYSDVFHALDNLGQEFTEDVGRFVMQLLEPIHFKGTNNSDYNNRYSDLRKALEIIFRHMVKMNILPPIIISKNEKGNVNLSWSSLFLGGKLPKDINLLPDSEKKFWCKVVRNIESPILPKQLSYWLKSAVFQTGGAVHTSNGEAEIAMNLDNYRSLVNGSPYMLRSLTMGLCDFILWYDNFVRKNADEEINAIKFWSYRNSKI